MKYQNTKFQELFGDSNRVKIMEFYLESGDIAFPIEAVVEEKNIGKSQTYEIINSMIKNNILIEDKIYNKKRFYKLNKKNETILELIKLFNKIIIP